MLETFSEAARRAIFFARLEASRLSFDMIEAEHLVLGFIAEDQGDSQRYFEKAFGMDLSSEPGEPGRFFIDTQIAARLRENLSFTGNRAVDQSQRVNMFLSGNAQQALAAAYAQASGATVTPLHLLLGILSNDANPATACLIEHGVTEQRVKEAIRGL